MMTIPTKRLIDFEKWYEVGPAVFLNEDEMPQYASHLLEMHISMTFGVFQRFFLQQHGLWIYVKPDYDKFSIHIEHCMDKKTLFQSYLINNNINSVQKQLVAKAFEITSK